MSEPRELPRPPGQSIPAVLAPGTPVPTSPEDAARDRIAALDREARAMGAVPAAALLFHEMGLLWETRLKHPRNAAVAYQSAFKLAPRFVANIRAARRLFAEVGNWLMVVQLIDAELAATPTPRSQASLLFEKAQILEQRLSQDGEAAAALQQCLALQPADITLLVQLEAEFAEKADHASLARVYQLLAGAVSEDPVRAAYLTSAGLLLEDRLKDLIGAAALFRQAFTIDRRDPQLLAAIKRVAQREGTVDEELAALAAEAESQGPAAGATFLQISKAYERLGRPEDALAALLAARRVSPADPLVLSELARIYESQERFAELADVLLAWVQLTQDEPEQVALNLRLAGLYEQLQRDQDAVGRYQAIVARAPGHAGALAALGRLHHKAGNWAGLLETYEAEAAATDDPRQRAARVYRAAETLEEHLGRVDEAINRYQACLALAPGFLPAQKALTRLYEKLGRWPDLIAMYEQDLLQAHDQDQQVALLNKIATLYEDRVKDVGHAIDCLKRVQDLSPDHPPTLHALARLYEAEGRWTELLDLNDHQTRLAVDTKQVVSLAHRNAEILEEQLKNRPAAIAAWERVLTLSPNYLPALRALGRLYGQDGRWDALARMYRTEAEIAPGTEQAAALIQKMGELQEHKLGELDLAISSYREVLTLAPSHVPALRALARIYRTQGDWESLIEILHAEAATRTDPTERANAMFQAAAIWEDQLGRPRNAIEGYQEVLRLVPGHATAVQNLERLLTARDDVKELIVLLDRQAQTGSEAARVACWLKLARLYLDRLNEPARAAACCESALGLDPSNLGALRLLERIRANDRPRRTELRARVAQVTGDARLATAITVTSLEEQDAGTPEPAVLERLKGAARADPTDEALGLVLEKALTRAGDAAGLTELLERRRATAADLADRLQLLLRIGELHETQTGDDAAALQAYERALEAAPDLYPALAGRARCAERLGDPARARATLESLAEVARDPSTRNQALLDAAALARDQERNDDTAAALLRRILDREPLHPEAGPALEELLARRGGAGDLVALHEKRGEARLAQRDLGTAAREFLEAARGVLVDGAQRPRALALLDRALTAVPTHPEALELKGTLCLEAQDHAGAAAAWSARVQQGGEPRALGVLHHRLGLLFADHLGDPTRAAAHLQSAVAADPADVEALERLVEIHGASRNFTGAADCLRRLLEVETAPPARARHTMALARLCDEGFNDVGQAITLYRKALELQPADPAPLDRLAVLYERTGALPELVQLLERQAQQAGDPKRAVAARTRIATLQGNQLNEPARAVASWQKVLDSDPSNLAAHVALAELYGRDVGSIALAIEAHRNLLRLEPTRVESLHALFRMWESLRQVDKAYCAAALLAFLKATNETEAAFHAEGRNRLPGELRGQLNSGDLVTLHHPHARGPLVDVLRAVGDQVAKLHPPQFELLGIDRKADRLKSDHALHKALQAVTGIFGVESFDVYQARRGQVFLETTEPLSVCIGPEVVRKSLREQRFLYGRAALGLLDRTALLRKLAPGELADFLGNAVRILRPAWDGLGRRSEDQVKQLKRAFSRKALKALEEPADATSTAPRVPIELLVQGLTLTADRAGLLTCADVAAGLGVLLREDAPPTQTRSESAEAIAVSVAGRPDVKELMVFALSDDFFRLRQRVGISLG